MLFSFYAVLTAFYAVIFSLYAVLFLLYAVAYSLYAVLFLLCTEVKSLYAVQFSCKAFSRYTRCFLNRAAVGWAVSCSAFGLFFFFLTAQPQACAGLVLHVVFF